MKIVVLFLLMFSSLSITCFADMVPMNLRCEYQNEPLGLDRLRPRLNWNFRSDQRGEYQTAYRILVATDRKMLSRDEADLWDSGKVEDSSLNALYRGEELKSRSDCYWKVQGWDKDDKRTPWSGVSRWRMGLLGKADWQGRWISASEDTGAAALYLRG